MRNATRIHLALISIALSALLVGCAPPMDVGTTGSGGAQGSGGGTVSSGGATGSGGAGPTTATGGSSPGSSGGATGSGGASASGGRTATGGSTASGGRTATGGSTGTGGTTASGGTSASGGRTATGGSTASGGRTATGGTAASGGASATGGRTGTGGATTTGDPPTKTVRVFWLRPSDVPFDQKYPDGIGKVLVEAQKFYKQELGKTFTLNNPIVEVVVGDHVKSWYENTANGGDKYWWSVTNMQQELQKKFGLKGQDSRWMIVGEVSAEGDGAGGGGSPGWVILCQHDADGAAGVTGMINRWYGGMVHELGHAFGLPDASSDDGTPMSGALYSYPNCHFNASQKSSIMSGPYGSFLN
jgi:hypothetical protein